MELKLLDKIERSIETPAKEKAAVEIKKKAAEDKSKMKKKKKQLIFGALFTSDKSFDCGDSDFLVSEDGIVVLRWKDFKVVMLLTNGIDTSNMLSVEQQQKAKSEKLKHAVPSSKNIMHT